MGVLLKVEPSGRWRVDADISDFEDEHNPAGGPRDSNPYGVLAVASERYVTDAGGNDLLRIAANGKVSLAATLSAASNGAEPVPTEVEMGPDGSLYVSLLTGAPFTAGVAGIYKIVPGQAPQLYVRGISRRSSTSHLVPMDRYMSWRTRRRRWVSAGPDVSPGSRLNGNTRPSSPARSVGRRACSWTRTASFTFRTRAPRWAPEKCCGLCRRRAAAGQVDGFDVSVNPSSTARSGQRLAIQGHQSSPRLLRQRLVWTPPNRAGTTRAPPRRLRFRTYALLQFIMPLRILP